MANVDILQNVEVCSYSRNQKIASAVLLAANIAPIEKICGLSQVHSEVRTGALTYYTHSSLLHAT